MTCLFILEAMIYMFPNPEETKDECLDELKSKWKDSKYNPVLAGKRSRKKIVIDEGALEKKPEKKTIKKNKIVS